jgi:hypothetical protein
MAGRYWHHLQLIDKLESDRNSRFAESQYWEVAATNAGNAGILSFMNHAP